MYMRAAALVCQHCISPQSVVEEVCLEQRLTRLTRGRKGERAKSQPKDWWPPELRRPPCSVRDLGAPSVARSEPRRPIARFRPFDLVLLNQHLIASRPPVSSHSCIYSCIYSCISLLPSIGKFNHVLHCS